MANDCWTWDVSDVERCECALFPVSAGYGDYAMVFNLRASIGSDHNLRGQQCFGLEFYHCSLLDVGTSHGKVLWVVCCPGPQCQVWLLGWSSCYRSEPGLLEWIQILHLD